MVSIELMDQVMRVLQPKRLILVGDVDQLPAVGPGRVLGDILDTKLVPSVCLTKVQRQAEHSQIVVNAQAIRSGQSMAVNPEKKDFFINRGTRSMHLDLLKRALVERVPKLTKADGTPVDPVWDVMVVAPQHKGVTGVTNLNNEIRDLVNPLKGQGEIKTIAGTIFREGDKIIVNKNLISKGVVNGEVGRITHVEPGMVQAEFENSKTGEPVKVRFDREELNFIQPGYACTVHKSQGSESPVLIAVFNEETPQVMRVRNLLYTAITRGSKLVWVLGDDRVLNQCIENNHPAERKTQLGRMMQANARDIYETGAVLSL
jgi:exodeoxyribonuclease V alpha subunit